MRVETKTILLVLTAPFWLCALFLAAILGFANSSKRSV